MPWYSFTLDHPEGSRVMNELLRSPTVALGLVRGGNPPHAAIFCRQSLRDGSTTFYISPRLAEHAPSLAPSYFAEPCDAPQRSGRLSLLIGDQRSFDILAPVD
jgi:hypothetical protein